ncbi:glycosyltransferase family 9 protein, partial [Actinoplanes philippinensis]|uniref:glycosyltransferase family 9 protein n=1 Tax=Actinoplanes philippinensis TaxID=35752 RepID=UPI003F4CD0DA
QPAGAGRLADAGQPAGAGRLADAGQPAGAGRLSDAGQPAGAGRLAGADRLAGGSVDDAGPMSFAELGALIAGARCLIVANTGPAHLAAAVGTPVISLYAPTVPYGRWGPYRVPAVRLGDAAAACRDTRATRCPVPGHPCLSGVTPDDVLTAVRRLGVTAPQPNHDEVAA